MHPRTFNPLSLAALLVLGHGVQGVCYAQTASSTTSAPEGEDLETITVTGTRIRQVNGEGPSPVFVQTGEQLQAQGFTTVYEALRSFTQVTGSAQNDVYAGGFTQNASVINMRGLGAGRTLVLLDGRRIAEYPLPYNGESNFVNIAAIPAAAIERIEVLSGGASAIYGSDAVAGVVNIILRKDVPERLDLNVRTGATTQGGGESTRVQGVGGYSNDVFKLTYAAEYLHRDPIYGYERDFMDSVDDNPNPDGRIAARAILRDDPLDMDGDGLSYIDPGPSACAAFPGFEYSFRPGSGYYCGQRNANAQQTVRNGRKQGSLYLNATMDVGDAEVFGSLNYFRSNSELDDNVSYWFPALGYYVYNTNSDLFESLQRYFLPSEQGGREARLNKFTEQTWDFAAGIRGDFGDTAWRYETTLSYSDYNVENNVRRLLFDEVENYFLGPLLYTVSGYPAYAVNTARLFMPLTPDTYNQLSAVQHETSDSSTGSATVVVSGDLWQLPAGMVSVAGVAEWGTQKYSIHPDPRLVAGDFWSLAGSGGGGERDRYAAGLELSIPIVQQLRASLAGRYDKYDDVTKLDDAVTYKAGLEYRPDERILLRGSAASSFRAPDMHYVFADPSGFYEIVTDYYLCRRDEPGVAFSSCSNADISIAGTRQGDPDLKEETGESFTMGVVLEPLADLKLSIDYYHIALENLVIDRTPASILETEADCRLGQTRFGTPVNINSAECQDALARVQRNSADAPAGAEMIQLIATRPINTAKYKTNGVDVQFNYAFSPARMGRFNLQAAYTHVLKYEIQDFANDPIRNARDDLQSFDQQELRRFGLRSHIRSSLTWDYRAISATLFGERLGSTANWAETGRVGAQTYFNTSLSYSLLQDRASVGLTVNNVFDKNPPRDSTYDEYPYFSTAYSPIGREWFVQLRYKFD